METEERISHSHSVSDIYERNGEERLVEGSFLGKGFLFLYKVGLDEMGTLKVYIPVSHSLALSNVHMV